MTELLKCELLDNRVVYFSVSGFAMNYGFFDNDLRDPLAALSDHHGLLTVLARNE